DFNIKFSEIEKINIKEDLIFKLRNGGSAAKVVHVPFNYLKDYMRPACNACSDFTNIYADISFGGLGSQDKYTTVITRTNKGKHIFQKIIDAGVVKCLNLDSFKISKMIEKISQFSLSKVNRGDEFMKKFQ
ncbi:MAG: Coenzyme F420 hydrogenase/dehydrogenase, beta subunit C-terminal domain, partial [Candidatus Thorarchaeota archaeon]